MKYYSLVTLILSLFIWLNSAVPADAAYVQVENKVKVTSSSHVETQDSQMGQNPSLSPTQSSTKRMIAILEPVNNSQVDGYTLITQRSNDQYPRISIIAFGLQPGIRYYSLYSNNAGCTGPVNQNNKIGNTYTANGDGIGFTSTKFSKELQGIHSISIIRADTQTLVGCST
ncbi:hypothetical protein HGB07_05155 [Candidatus Roizmanbacteria bacterium]|nr:hypothetical protein [Candidatus Roizmanbacteria bacterium]